MPAKIELFDPPMCCPGGLCGLAIDPALLDLNEAILKLKMVTSNYTLNWKSAFSPSLRAFVAVPSVVALVSNC
jgi:hypothetical protein